MNILEEELIIMKKVRSDMMKATDRKSVNEIYRQARTWNRLHHFFAKACSYERYTFLNNKFKHARRDALKNY